MPLLLKKSDNKSLFGIWEINETEKYFLEQTDLSKNDIHLLEKIKNQKRKLEVLAVRLLIKKLKLNLDISYTETGKPIVDTGKISISHSDKLAGIIYHPALDCSIDIEKISEKITRTKHKAFCDDEIDFAKNDKKKLTILWCCKECIFKIANKQGIDFINQIKIKPFKKNESIFCDFIDDTEIKTYKLEYIEIKNYIIVWCFDGKAKVNL